MTDQQIEALTSELRLLNHRLGGLSSVVDSLDRIGAQLARIDVSLGGYEIEGESIPTVAIALKHVTTDLYQMKMAFGGYVEDGVLTPNVVEVSRDAILEKLTELDSSLMSIETAVQLIE